MRTDCHLPGRRDGNSEILGNLPGPPRSQVQSENSPSTAAETVTQETHSELAQNMQSGQRPARSVAAQRTVADVTQSSTHSGCSTSVHLAAPHPRIRYVLSIKKRFWRKGTCLTSFKCSLIHLHIKAQGTWDWILTRTSQSHLKTQRALIHALFGRRNLPARPWRVEENLYHLISVRGCHFPREDCFCANSLTQF